jgi:hypothetical protein
MELLSEDDFTSAENTYVTSGLLRVSPAHLSIMSSAAIELLLWSHVAVSERNDEGEECGYQKLSIQKKFTTSTVVLGISISNFPTIALFRPNSIISPP